MKTRLLPLIVIILALTNLVSVYFLMQKPAELENPFPLVDFSRSFIPQEHFIVNVSPLREELNDLVSRHKDLQVSLYMEFLNTGSNININSELGVWPASLIKLPIALAATKKVENGVWKWDDELVLYDKDKNADFGTLYQQPEGSRHTIESLVSELLSNSDNTAYYMLLRNIETLQLEDVVKELGMEGLYDQDRKIRVKDYGRIMRSLYVSSYLKRENSQKFLTFLTQSTVNDMASQGIPKHIPFAHKIAINRKLLVFGDAGIVYLPNRPYLISLMVQCSDLEQEQEAVALIHDMSKMIYEYFSTYE